MLFTECLRNGRGFRLIVYKNCNCLLHLLNANSQIVELDLPKVSYCM